MSNWQPSFRPFSVTTRCEKVKIALVFKKDQLVYSAQLLCPPYQLNTIYLDNYLGSPTDFDKEDAETEGSCTDSGT